MEYKPMQVVGPQTDPDSNLQYKNLVDFSIILLYKQKGGPPLRTLSLSHIPSLPPLFVRTYLKLAKYVAETPSCRRSDLS